MHDATMSISGAIKTLLIWPTPGLWNHLEGDSLLFFGVILAISANVLIDVLIFLGVFMGCHHVINHAW